MVASHVVVCLHVLASLGAAPTVADQQFEQLAADYVDQFPSLSPVAATQLGNHLHDSELDDISPEARGRSVGFHAGLLTRLDLIDVTQLSRANQVDHALLEHEVRAQLWRIKILQEWAWNPLIYTELAGSAIYGLMAREFAPLPKRLEHVTERLTKFPRMFAQIRGTLDPRRVPRIHAETAIKQNPGVVSILANMVEPHLGQLDATQRQALIRAIDTAKASVKEHQAWLETDLLPNALGDFRIGKQRFDQKLAFTLQTPLSRQQIRERAESELRRVRAEMYTMAADVYRRQHPYTQFPETPSAEYQQAMIRAALEMAYQETPEADRVVEAARASLALTTEFVRAKDLITIPADPLEIIVMPEFQRGVSLAYCDSPGPLDVGQKTFYAVAPLPKNWNAQQIRSFLREYNVRSIHDLTVHEAMPGHFVQLAHSNRYPGKLRAVLASGVFIEGWAVYTEQMMADEGLLDGDPLMGLIARKWYLRGIANAILDQAMHTEGITRDQAMRLMMEDTFQEEREAAAKWIRAQLTSTQLSTYFVGYLEHADLRREAESKWGDDFRLKDYHDNVLSFGSPPVKYARALLLDQEIPR